MYCRTCGNKINDNAEICVKCGCKPLIGKDYCQSCGARTTQKQEACTKCGKRLLSVMTTAQKKKKVENTGLKIVGNILKGMGWFFFAFMVWNLVVFAMNMGTYAAVGHGAAAFRCLILGLVCYIPGRTMKKKARKRK